MMNLAIHVEILTSRIILQKIISFILVVLTLDVLFLELYIPINCVHVTPAPCKFLPLLYINVIAIISWLCCQISHVYEGGV